MLLMFYKVHIKNRTQTSTHQQKFVKNILLGLLGGFLHAKYFFYSNFLLVWFFYSNIFLKLDFSYNIFVFNVIMFLFSNFLLLVCFFTPIFYFCVFFTQILS